MFYEFHAHLILDKLSTRESIDVKTQFLCSNTILQAKLGQDVLSLRIYLYFKDFVILILSESNLS